MKQKHWFMTAFVVACMVMAAGEVLFYWFDSDMSRNTAFLVNLVTVLCLVLWLNADSKEHRNIYRPYEYGQLLMFLWLPYLPYYLWRTRGPVGLLLLCCILLLFFAGTLMQWGLYLAYRA